MAGNETLPTIINTMELRKDPVTQSWMLVGDEPAPSEQSGLAEAGGPCGFCGGGAFASSRVIDQSGDGMVKVYSHPYPIYRIEGNEGRAAEGIYDRMRTVGAHEVVIENPTHERHLSLGTDQEAAAVLGVFGARITDLKKDGRFRYVTVFKNRGRVAGEEFTHAHSQITATPFIPRRMVYELRAALQHFKLKERCVFCDIVQQEEDRGTRVVEATANYLALCPFAPRVPYELWVLPRYHAASFEQDFSDRNRAARPDVSELGGILRRSLSRVERVAGAFHLVLHTTPNTAVQKGLTPQWITLADDYHWHFEILPIAEKRTRSYSIKEVYYSAVSPERAATVLRQVAS